MRNTTLIVAGALLLGAALFSWWPAYTNSTAVNPSPPGQYPLGKSRYEWPATVRSAAYRPSNTTGTNDADIAGVKDVKAVCALSTLCPQ